MLTGTAALYTAKISSSVAANQERPRSHFKPKRKKNACLWGFSNGVYKEWKFLSFVGSIYLVWWNKKSLVKYLDELKVLVKTGRATADKMTGKPLAKIIFKSTFKCKQLYSSH